MHKRSYASSFPWFVFLNLSIMLLIIVLIICMYFHIYFKACVSNGPVPSFMVWARVPPDECVSVSICLSVLSGHIFRSYEANFFGWGDFGTWWVRMVDIILYSKLMHIKQAWRAWFHNPCSFLTDRYTVKHVFFACMYFSQISCLFHTIHIYIIYLYL